MKMFTQTNWNNNISNKDLKTQQKINYEWVFTININKYLYLYDAFICHL